MVEFVPNIEYIWGAIGIIIVVIIIWTILKRKTGRLAEEVAEEKETKQLEKDEKDTIKLQKDEKKNCKIMDGLFSDIMIILRNGDNNALAEQISRTRMRISYILNSLKKEKMSLRNARDSFLELHNLINQFISQLPKDNEIINIRVAEIIKYQNNYYRDLVQEVAKQRHQLQIVEDLKNKIIDEMQGGGYQMAA